MFYLDDYVNDSAALFYVADHVKDAVASPSDEEDSALLHLQWHLAIACQVKEIELRPGSNPSVLRPKQGEGLAFPTTVPHLTVGEDHHFVHDNIVRLHDNDLNLMQ
jgi:hypothetical protein